MDELGQRICDLPSLAAPLLEVHGLAIDYWQDRWVSVVRGISFAVRRGDTLGLAGESGCGKSTTSLALLGFHRLGSRISGGTVHFAGRDLLQMKERELRHLRGGRIGFVPQDPATALSPAMKVGRQILETLHAHKACRSRHQARGRLADLLEQVSLPAEVASKYPHQLSGGQQQRIAIAMALACEPDLLVLDEPTTALDVTTQGQILELLNRLKSAREMAMVYVTHNLGVLAWIADSIGIMYAGELVEVAPTVEVFHAPHHPYTRGLIAAVPRITAPAEECRVQLRGRLERQHLPPGCPFAPRCDFAQRRCEAEPQVLKSVGVDHHVACWRWSELQSLAEQAAAPTTRSGPRREARLSGWEEKPLLEVNELNCAYASERGLLPWQRQPKTVVHHVSFAILPHETFALVGESGSGKSTIARSVTGLLRPSAGRISYEGEDLAAAVPKRSKQLRRSIQPVFQNPDASLNPRQRVRQIVGRPLEFFFDLSKNKQRDRVAELLECVKLEPSFMDRFPDQLSGGERQRVALARALAAEPTLLLCDEILSALDVSVQADILRLLRELQAERGMSYLFISHDLAVVRSIAHHVGVLYLGQLLEVGTVDEVFEPPSHPYTTMLLAAVPEADPKWRPRSEALARVSATAREGNTACPFAPRCGAWLGRTCEQVPAPWQRAGESHFVRCHIPRSDLLAWAHGTHTERQDTHREETA